ncbi:hypothetical protein CHS0354_040650 [Potamilus streckersoni]|uniref:Uncharacterized protein n=1 Tax=Potamilus streckersoni TaxID=2493646 RepID=A0AAE0TC73_9BIVA|nr:hypothetical protein CHS0354_040650 [Potamilus streckersoni]
MCDPDLILTIDKGDILEKSAHEWKHFEDECCGPETTTYFQIALGICLWTKSISTLQQNGCSNAKVEYNDGRTGHEAEICNPDIIVTN